MLRILHGLLNSTTLLLLGGGLSAYYLADHVSATWLSTPLVVCAVVFVACALATLIWQIPIWMLVRWLSFAASANMAVYFFVTEGWNGLNTATAVALTLGVGFNSAVCAFNFFNKLYTDEVFPVGHGAKPARILG